MNEQMTNNNVLYARFFNEYQVDDMMVCGVDFSKLSNLSIQNQKREVLRQIGVANATLFQPVSQ